MEQSKSRERTASEKSTLIRERPDRGEEQDVLRGESDGSSSTPLQDSSVCDGEARNYVWSISVSSTHRHHVEPRVKLYVPREASFLIPLKKLTDESNPLGGDQDLRTSTLVRQRPIRGEGHVDFLGESGGSLPTTSRTHFRMPVKR